LTALLCLSLADAPAQESSQNSVTIEYIAHACFRVISPSGEQLLIDPFASRVWIGYDYPDSIESDAVLITHPHYDHDGGVSVDQAPPWSNTTTVLREPNHYAVGDIEILGVAGKHADPYGKEFGQTNTIWVIEVAGLRIAHLGDNGPLSANAAASIGEVDILMMPADADFHILQEHEIQPILDQLSPDILIPMHYRHADLEPDDGPSGLGGIDGWLEKYSSVRRLAKNKTTLSLQDLPGSMEILVFEHSPLMKRPASDE
jgi:L-ascorbate metabolism protein UlaG (beta-lactamase superfamily)